MRLRKFFDAVAGFSLIQHIGHLHGIIEAPHADATTAKQHVNEFQVVRDLENAVVQERRRQLRQGVGFVEVLRTRTGKIQLAFIAAGQRNVTGATRRRRERYSDEACAHGVC